MNFTHTWTYDNAGNITSRTDYAFTDADLQNPLETVIYEYTDANWGDLLTIHDGNAIIYDELGNPLNDGEWTYTWQNGRQLAAMSKGSTTWTFTCDANGMRTSRVDEDGTWSHKPGVYPVQYCDSSGNEITDPATCDRGRYTYFFGYYKVGPN